MHSYESMPASAMDIYAEYCKKTIHRLQAIQPALPYAFDKTIKINNKRCINILYQYHVLRAAVMDNLMDIKKYCPIHGDCQLTNTMIDKNGKVYFIDARGYFGGNQVFGDVRYDWAKVYYALAGNFDQFNIKNFDLEISGGVSFKIQSGGWEFLTEYFLNEENVDECWKDEQQLFRLLHDAQIQVPAGVSERLEKSIMQMEAPQKSLSRKRTMYYWVSSAAAVVLLCIGLFFATREPATPQMADTFSNPEEAAQVAAQTLAFVSTQLNKGINKAADAGVEIEKVNQILGKQLNN
jgi:hypothetical protein